MENVVECCLFTFGLLQTSVRVTILTVKSIVLWFLPRHLKDITDDIVLITGGGRGIGRALALEFARYKPKHIVLWGRTEETLHKTTQDVRAIGVKCSYMVCDVTIPDDIYKKVEEIKQMIGPVTILVNNAGVVYGKKIINCCDNELTNTFRVNVLAHTWTIKAVLPDMINSGRGHLVNINSLLGLMGLCGAGDYCSSKFATTGLMEALFWELEEIPDIHLTSVHPYQVDNQMFSGMKIRFPWLIPPLDEKYVARKTVSAVLCNTKTVIMPRLMYLVIWMKSLLPVTAMIPIQRFLGADAAMDNFGMKEMTKVT